MCLSNGLVKSDFSEKYKFLDSALVLFPVGCTVPTLVIRFAFN